MAIAGFEYALALTGSIGTGKSSVAKIFASWGFRVIDADKIAHEVLDSQHEAIERLFGQGLSDGTKVDRKALGAIIFGDKEKRLQLEALLHPLIFDKIQKLSIDVDRYQKPYLIDIPLFFEKGNYPIAKSLVVYTKREEQLRRVMHRDNLSQEEVLLRISSQLDIEIKCQRATYLIDNNGTEDALRYNCEKIKTTILKDFQHDTH